MMPTIGVSRAIAFDAADYGGTLSFDTTLVSKDSAVYDPGFPPSASVAVPPMGSRSISPWC